MNKPLKWEGLVFVLTGHCIVTRWWVVVTSQAGHVPGSFSFRMHINDTNHVMGLTLNTPTIYNVSKIMNGLVCSFKVTAVACSRNLGTYLSVLSVGAKAFVRFLSGRIGQHHLHLHPIHDPTVEHSHGLICTLKDRNVQKKSRQNNTKAKHHFTIDSIPQLSGVSPVCLHTSCIQPSSQKPNGPQ